MPFISDPSTSRILSSCIVFSDLASQQYVCTSGLKFGCDFLVYDSDPSEVHSTFMCHVYEDDDSASSIMTGTQLQCISRLATAARKAVLIAHVIRRRVHHSDDDDDEVVDLAVSHSSFSVRYTSVLWDGRLSNARKPRNS